MQNEMIEDDDEYEWVPVTDPDVLKKYVGVKGVAAAGKFLDKGSSTAPDVAWDQLPAAPTGEAAKAFTKVNAARAMLKQSQKVEQIYERDLGKGGPAGLADFIPWTKKNDNFDGQNDIIPLLARAAFRVPGSGADSNQELQLLLDSVPDRWKSDTKNRARFMSLDTILSDHIKNYGNLAGFTQEQTARMIAEAGGTPAETSTDNNALLDQMVKEGRTPQEIMQFLKDSGSDPTVVDAQKQAITDDRNYRHANPQAPKGAPLVIPNAPPSATQRPMDAAAIKAKYGIK